MRFGVSDNSSACYPGTPIASFHFRCVIQFPLNDNCCVACCGVLPSHVGGMSPFIPIIGTITIIVRRKNDPCTRLLIITLS
jgi:hypothetical protein